MAMKGLGSGRTGQHDRPATGQHDRPGQHDRTGTGSAAIHAPAGTAQTPSRPGMVTSALGGRFVPAGTNNPWRWFFSAVWLVYLVQPISSLFSRVQVRSHGHIIHSYHHGPLWIACGLALAAAFCAVYILLLIRWGEHRTWGRAGLAAIVVLSAVACAVYGKDWLPLWIYVSAATGVILTGEPDGRQRATRGVLAVGACYVFFGWLAHDDIDDFVVVLLPVVLIGLAMIGFRLQIGLMHELAQARETVAKLAANEERLRLARDMHDLTGQSLSMITLKSELAAKRLSRLGPSAERDLVLGDLGDIGRVSRQTLHDIREAVSGYRRPTLAIEVITAQNALDAAGIRLDDDPALTLRSGTFDADAEAVLAWCLREAVTNVIRHSGARTCRICLRQGDQELSLEVSDDGHGPAVTKDPADAGGAGLRGMSERLDTVGGRLSLETANQPRGQGFKLTATVPVDHYDD